MCRFWRVRYFKGRHYVSLTLLKVLIVHSYSSLGLVSPSRSVICLVASWKVLIWVVKFNFTLILKSLIWILIYGGVWFVPCRNNFRSILSYRRHLFLKGFVLYKGVFPILKKLLTFLNLWDRIVLEIKHRIITYLVCLLELLLNRLVILLGGNLSINRLKLHQNFSLWSDCTPTVTILINFKAIFC